MSSYNLRKRQNKNYSQSERALGIIRRPLSYKLKSKYMSKEPFLTHWGEQTAFGRSFDFENENDFYPTVCLSIHCILIVSYTNTIVY